MDTYNKEKNKNLFWPQIDTEEDRKILSRILTNRKSKNNTNKDKVIFLRFLLVKFVFIRDKR